jgi:hypothetical protein
MPPFKRDAREPTNAPNPLYSIATLFSWFEPYRAYMELDEELDSKALLYSLL